jgi:hypothetical protein
VVLQSLLSNSQLLHLPPPGHQFGLLVPQSSLPTIDVELAGQDLGTDILQSFSLPFEVSITTIEAGLAGTQDLKLTAEGDAIQLFPLLQLPLSLLQLPLSLLQQPLQLFHLSCPPIDLAYAHGKVLLLLDDNVGPVLGRCVQLLRIGKGTHGVGVTLGDGLHLQVEAMLSCPHRHPLHDRRPFEHAGPQLEASMLISEVLTFVAQDALHLRHGPVSRAHDLAQGNVIQRIRGGMPQDHLQSRTERSALGSSYEGHQ